MNTYSNRPTLRRTTWSLLILIALLFSFAGCEEYDAPPDVEIAQPEGGAFAEGEVIRLQFSEPIDTSTLTIQVWPTERGTSRTPRTTDVQPIITCSLKDESCGDLTLRVDEKGEWAEIEIDGDLGIPGVPLVLEILPGLTDEQGNETGVSRFFDFQFRAVGCESEVDVDFDDGVYILSATVNQPMTAVLTLVTHMITLPDGKFAMAGAKGAPIGDAPKNERDPEKIRIPDDKTGFALFAKGCVTVQKNGKRLLETEPVDVELPVLSLVLKLTNVRIFAEVKPNPDTGKDRIEGTLSYEALELHNKSKVTTYEGASTAVSADFVPEDVRPVGHPEICGNLCGVVAGICNPPEEFPGEDFCQ